MSKQMDVHQCSRTEIHPRHSWCIIDDDAEPITPTYMCNGMTPKSRCEECGCTCYMCEKGHNHGAPFVVFGHQSSCETRRRR